MIELSKYELKEIIKDFFDFCENESDKIYLDVTLSETLDKIIMEFLSYYEEFDE